MRRLALLAAGLLLAACGPRRPILARQDALADARELRVRVLETWDAVRVEGPTEGSHVIEVEVLAGPEDRRGARLSLPYDEWAVGAPPPRPGTEVTMSPRRWVAVDGASGGRPFAGWDEVRPLDR